jgi:hypothetical protein
MAGNVERIVEIRNASEMFVENAEELEPTGRYIDMNWRII